MRWLGRGRALYKWSIGGHSALDSKDHVCEPGFSVRKAFAPHCLLAPPLPSEALAGGRSGAPAPRACQVTGEASRREGAGAAPGRRGDGKDGGRGGGREASRGRGARGCRTPSLSAARRDEVATRRGKEERRPAPAALVPPRVGQGARGFRSILAVPLDTGRGAWALRQPLGARGWGREEEAGRSGCWFS